MSDVATQLMDHSVEFELTRADVRQQISDINTKTFLFIRQTIICLFLFLNIQTYVQSGVNYWLLPFTCYLFLELIIPRFYMKWLIPCVVMREPMQIQVSWDENGISISTSGTTKQYLWESFAKYGSVKELNNTFELTCGRGSVLIPKRAFHSMEKMADFRQFVAEKVGKNCHFKEMLSQQ